MGSIDELKDAVKDTLERKGLLRQLQAHVRSQVYQVLLDAEEEPRPEPCNENLLINELIREYLIYNGYRDTLSVFLAETGLPQTRPFNRSFLVQQLDIADSSNTGQVPLLYTLAARQPVPATATTTPAGHKASKTHLGKLTQEQEGINATAPGLPHE